MTYFIIYSTDSGNISIEEVDKETLLDRIKPEDGEEDFCYYGRVGFLDKIQDEDPSCWGKNLLIIKGEIITPKPKEIVKTFDVD